MFWAIASSVFVIYLYRTLNAGRVPPPGDGPADAVEVELAALDARIAVLESKIGRAGSVGAKP